MTVAQMPYAAGVPAPKLAVVPDDVSTGSLDVDELGSRIIGLAGRLAAATCKWLLLVAAFDAQDGCARFGLGTTARWLAHYCGLSKRTARDHVRVARVLAAHAALAAAMSAGRLSYSQVRAISRLADVGDDQVIDDLIEVAEQGTVGQLEAVVRGLRTVDHNERDAAGEVIPESVSHRWRPDSRWGLSAQLDPENGALVQAAIEAVARREGLTQAAALTRIAEIALAATDAGVSAPAPTLRGDERAAVLIHLTAAAIPAAPVEIAAPAEIPDDTTCSGSAEPPHGGRTAGQARPYARIEDGPGLPDRVINRLLCEGRIRTVVEDGEGNPLDLGRSRRLVSQKQFRALLLRDGGCAHPGCGAGSGLEAHHVRHWLHGGRTDLANLVLLCRRHHHTHHDGEFTITPLRRGRFRFRRADGGELPHHADPSRQITNAHPVEDEHPDVRPDAATTRWDGTRLDHGYAVATLAQHLPVVQLNRLAGTG